MDFEKAEDLFLRVYEESNNELECLIADIGMMKICQRTAMNKEFYDYRNSALRRMKRISDDRSAITDPGELERLIMPVLSFPLLLPFITIICSRNSSPWRRLMK